MMKNDESATTSAPAAPPDELAPPSTPRLPTDVARDEDGTVPGEPTRDGATKTWLLPSGKRATMLRMPRGRHLRAALKVIGADRDQTTIMFALVAQCTTIDGKAITFEDVDEMNLPDVGDLQAKMSNAKEGAAQGKAASS